MRASFVVTTAAAVACAVCAACAASDNEETAPDSGENPTIVPDAATPVHDADASDDAADGATCSPAGWCRTSLPDSDLVLLDIWPLPGHAFALADSRTLGVKVLEWSEADTKWRYIDDSTQNAPDLDTYGGAIWAPSEDEVYFGVGPGYVYHGTRPSSPGATWTWTRQRLDDNDHAGDIDGWQYGPKVGRRSLALGVWGTSTSDVHAWFKNTIYRRSTAGAAPEWVPEYVANDFDDDAEHVFFTSVAAASPDDVWFAATRTRSSSACALIVRKTPAGYERIADATVSESDCTPKADLLMIGGAAGRLTDLQAAGGGQFIALKGALDLVRIATAGGGYTVDVSPGPGASVGVNGFERFTSVWNGAGAAWITTNGLVIRGTNLWDGGKYEISSIALRGSPITKNIYRVRGTDHTNLWAIGEEIALHKTTP